MPAADPVVDHLVGSLVDRPAGATLMRQLAELLVTDGRPDAARALATSGLRAAPGDLRLLRVLLDAGVELPHSVAELVDCWDTSPALREQ